MPAIKYKKKTYAGATFPVLELTKAEYDALPDAKKMDGTVYMITDDDGGWEAERSTYDNTTSGLTATNVQDALDELNSNMVAVWDKTYQLNIAAGATEVFNSTCPATYNGLRRISVTIETDCDLILTGFRVTGNVLRVSAHNTYNAAQTVTVSVHAVYSNCPFVQIPSS